MINKMRNRIAMYKGKIMLFKYKGSRNQIEEFVGYINDIYPNVFTIIVKDSNLLKCFSYNDVLIHKLVFKNANY